MERDPPLLIIDWNHFFMFIELPLWPVLQRALLILNDCIKSGLCQNYSDPTIAKFQSLFLIQIKPFILLGLVVLVTEAIIQGKVRLRWFFHSSVFSQIRMTNKQCLYVCVCFISLSLSVTWSPVLWFPACQTENGTMNNQNMLSTTEGIWTPKYSSAYLYTGHFRTPWRTLSTHGDLNHHWLLTKTLSLFFNSFEQKEEQIQTQS